MSKPVVCQTWCESERGWGQRPDGYSLHLTNADRVQFIKEYSDSLPPRGPHGEVPSIYSFAEMNHYITDVDEATYKKLKKSKNGLRFYETKAPERA